MSKQSYIGIVAALAVLIGIFAYITRSQQASIDPDATPPPPPPTQYNISSDRLNKNWEALLAAADGPALGNPNAPYTLIEIGDFQCPQCGRIRPLVEKFLSASNGQLKLYFVNFPLQMHPHAHFAAEAALAAANQGKFWQMYDLLYSHQDELIPSEVQYYSAQEIPGFSTSRYLADMSAPQIDQKIQHQISLVMSLGVQATPTFVIRQTAGGTPAWYVGQKDSTTSFGLQRLANAPPWLNGGKLVTFQSQQ